MAQYFFKMTQAEKNNILDQHKTIYDGYVTEYGQQSNTQPLYVQDYANDKVGITVSNKGVVKPYTNMGINESKDRNYNDEIISKEIDEYLNKVSICDKKYVKDDEEFILYAATDISEILYEKYVKKIDSGDKKDDTNRRNTYEDKFEKIVRLKYGNKIKKYFRDNIVDCVDPEDYKPMDNLNYDNIWNELQESHTGLDMIADDPDHLKNGTVDFEEFGFNPDEEMSDNGEFEFISLGLMDDGELEEGFDDFDMKRARKGVDYSSKEFPSKNKIDAKNFDFGLGDTFTSRDDEKADDEDFEYFEVDEEHGTFDHMSDEYGDEDLNMGKIKKGSHYMNDEDEYKDLSMYNPYYEDNVDDDILPEFMDKLNESLDMFKRLKNYN